jgi:transglutaminase-like putative cysteine protease
MADVGEMLDRRVGVAVALEHDRLALVRVEKDLVLERACVLRAYDLHRLLRQPLPFRDLAGEECDAGDAFDFLHCCWGLNLGSALLRILETPGNFNGQQLRAKYRRRIGEPMRISVSIVGACLLVAGPAGAQSDQVQRAPVPDWVAPAELMSVPADATGLMFLRRNEVLTHLDQQGQAQYQGYRVKILHSNALQLGNLAIAWNPAAGAPTVHMVKIYRQNEVIDVLRTTSFEILRREDQLEAARLDGLLTAVLRVPDLRVGDELEVGLTIRVNDPTLKDINSGVLTLAGSPAPGRFRLGLDWIEGNEPHLKMSSDMAAAAQRRDRAVTFDFDNPAVVSPPKDAPPRYKWQRFVEYSDFADWASVSRHLAPLYSKAAKFTTNSSLHEQASRIAAANSRSFDRASAALKLVQQEVRYIYVGLNGGNLTPATADETWQRRYGDCKGKTALLLGLLSELGIRAEPVLANNSEADDGIDARLPNPGLFDHVLVRARINGTDYWLDGTLPSVAGPSLKPVVPYRWVLPLTHQGSSIESLKWQAAESPDQVTLFEIDARAGFDKPARITNTIVLRGIKGLQQQVQFSAVTPAQLLTAMRQEMVGSTWQTIENAKWRYDVKSQASVTTISGLGTVDWESEDDGSKSLSLPGGGFNPPERRVRPDDQDQSIPFYNEEAGFNCYVTTVRLPTSTQASQWSFNSSFDTRLFGRNYYRTFGMRDGAISMIRGSRVEQREIDAGIAKQDNARIASFDNSMAMIYYDPADPRPVAAAGSNVPATYDFDWTSSYVPCLASLADRSSH